MKKAHIWVRDEVYMTIAGLEPSDVQFLWNKYGVPVDGYFFMPAYKLGRWDGKVSYFQLGGSTYINLLEEIIPFLAERGYDVDLEDLREYQTTFTFNTVDEHTFSHKTWLPT